MSEEKTWNNVIQACSGLFHAVNNIIASGGFLRLTDPCWDLLLLRKAKRLPLPLNTGNNNSTELSGSVCHLLNKGNTAD